MRRRLVLPMNLRRRTVYLSILVAMLLIGFVIGYLYTSSNLGTTITTYTYTVTVFNTTTITKTEIYTHTQTTTETYTVTQTTTVTAVETMTLKPRVILEYPSNPWSSADFNDDGTPEVFVEINPWNVKSYKGVQRVVIDLLSRGIEVYIDVKDVNPSTWANGYPEIIIGRKPWGKSYANGYGVPFPMRVRDAKPFIVSFYICLERYSPDMNLNIAADAWIVREPIAKSPGTPPGSGDLEVMVWLFSNNLNPAGNKVGETRIPIALNGTVVDAEWEVWRMDSVTWGGWQYIAFKPKNWKHVCGYVAYNPIDFVREATKYTTFDISDHYLLDWEIGTEWGTISSGGRALLLWRLRDFVTIPGTTISRS
jgi:hypothetical protein